MSKATKKAAQAAQDKGKAQGKGKGQAAPAPAQGKGKGKAAPAAASLPAQGTLPAVGEALTGAKGYTVVLNRGYYAVGHNPEAAPEARYTVRLSSGHSAQAASLASAKTWGKGEGYRAGLTTRATKASTEAGLTDAPAYKGKATDAPAAPAPAKGKGKGKATDAPAAPAKGKGKGKAAPAPAPAKGKGKGKGKKAA